MTRLERLAAGLTGRLLVTDPVNVRYLTGFASSNAALLVDPEQAPTLYTDFRYLEAAQELQGLEVELAARALVADLGERLEGALGFEADSLTYSDVDALGAGRLELVPTRGVVEAMRSVKEEGEVTRIHAAVMAAERAFEALAAEPWVGRSEKAIAWRLEELFHAHGVERLAFETVIASGPNGSRPHARASGDIVEPRGLVVADFGAVLDGYCSDCTRTFATGELPRDLRTIYDVCLEAQLVALELIRPGMSGVEADRLARGVIEQAGYGEEFGHGLGHGVGLEVHEGPTLSPSSTDTLEVGNVVTVEPGIYLPGLGGVRIEDLAVVTDGGLRVLTAFRKELVTVA